MAIYHFSAQIISRSNGSSSVGSSAYRSGEKIENERTGEVHDYTRKTGIEYTEIIAPSNAPEWASDRTKLWNEVEKIEKSKNSQLAREINIALPKELSLEKQIELTREFVKDTFVDKGMVADISIHDTQKGNPHAHIMLTMRPFENGEWGAKSKKEYVLDKQGNKQYDKKSRTYKCKTVKTTDWDNKEKIEEWREQWAKHTNKSLERAGIADRVDHRSYKDQGINKVATKHEGQVVRAMESRGQETDIGSYNKKVIEHNKMLELIDKQLKIYEKQKGEIENGRIENDGARNSNTRSEGGNIRGKEPTENLGTKILFGDIRGRNEVPSSRNDEPIQSFKENDRQGGEGKQEINGAIRGVQGEEKSRHKSVEQSNQGLETRNQGNEGLELQENRGSIKANNEPTRESQGASEVTEQFNSRDKEDRAFGLEGQSETICPTSGNISRSNTSSVGSLSADDLLNQIANSFKVKEEEKEKPKSKPIVREQPKPKAKVKSKSKGWERDDR
ncbi:MobQ family relaxase (plasmid) [Clostridium septicum]|uniref:MobQ family relaxase n=1 Tax=Clostridium septicum TaxID=1504 RepID=UPI00272E45B5|nr:MobQ family relaxase [Clostridium septicum]WLF71112.1 MobQ family relaxase [Clostridium septicum]